MSMYDSLPNEAKDRVDATVKTLEPLTWSDRRQKITALVLKMNPAGSEEAADPETPDPRQNPLWSAVGHYVAACIERLGFSEPDNQDQALVYLLSWDLEPQPQGKIDCVKKRSDWVYSTPYRRQPVVHLGGAEARRHNIHVIVPAPRAGPKPRRPIPEIGQEKPCGTLPKSLNLPP